MSSSRFIRAVGLVSLGVVTYLAPIDPTSAKTSHCNPGTVNGQGTCDCPKDYKSVGKSGDAHCELDQKASSSAVKAKPTCGGSGQPPCAKGVLPADAGTMVAIKGATAVVGSNDANDLDAGPTHPITLTDFKIDKYEVAVGDYEKCVKSGACKAPPASYVGVVDQPTRCNFGSGRAAHPMNCVSWDEAATYCASVKKRLPTEAEWEFAARGPKFAIYPWGAAAPTCKLANYSADLTKPEPGCGDGTAAIGSHATGASTFGVQDMGGNVEEWTWDYWGKFNGAPSPTNPGGPGKGTKRTIKGSSWDLTVASLHAAKRESADPTSRESWLGFRCGTGGDPVSAPDMYQPDVPEVVVPEIPPAEPAPDVPGPTDLGAMIKIPGGTFAMGGEDAKRKVSVSPYAMDKYEVTVSQYKQCVDTKACQPPLLLTMSSQCNWYVPGHENHPVNCVEWSDAKKYCAWAGKRLPTEAEWEFAERGNSDRLFPWGDESPTCKYAAFRPWDAQQCASSTMVVGTHPLGVSFYGLYDMGGNVEEWVYDWYGDYVGGTFSDPTGPATGDFHVIRGGNWDYEPSSLMTISRTLSLMATDYVGFRCAKTGG